MQFSIGVEYAFHSLFYLVDIPHEKSIGIKRIAELHGITETYLSKIFAKLCRAHIVTSIPGVKGGYALARNAEDISFWDIIEAVEGPIAMTACTHHDRHDCAMEGHCPVQPHWQVVNNAVRGALAGVSLTSLVGAAR